MFPRLEFLISHKGWNRGVRSIITFGLAMLCVGYANYALGDGEIAHSPYTKRDFLYRVCSL